MFPLDLVAKEQATWQGRESENQKKIFFRDKLWMVLNIMIGILIDEA